MIDAKYLKRFWSRVRKTDTCWLWTGTINSCGYGVMRVGGTPGVLIGVHRISYELAKGPIPGGLHTDHLCRVRNCVNPDHLEAVEPRVNWERGFSPAAILSRRDHCIRGHPLSGDNLYLRPDNGKRQCLTCRHANWREWYEKNKKKISERDKARRLEVV